MIEVEHAGDAAHPDHEQWLLALGRATYASQLLAGVALHVLRVHCAVDFWTLVPETLGRLVNRLKQADQRAQVPGLAAWLTELEQALIVRNDLMHALPVKHGLHRRTAQDKGRIVDFFDIEDLDEATATLLATHTSGSRILYHDGGTAVASMSR